MSVGELTGLRNNNVAFNKFFFHSVLFAHMALSSEIKKRKENMMKLNSTHKSLTGCFQGNVLGSALYRLSHLSLSAAH